jgi:hypothetical protein
MFLDRGISSRFEASHVDRDLLALIEELYHGPGIDHLELFADQGMGSTVVMLVTGQIDIIIFGQHELGMVPEFEPFGGKRIEQGLFRSQKLFFPTISLLLHPGLVVGPELYPNGLIERIQVKELPVTKFGIDTGIKNLDLILYPCLVLGFSCPGWDNGHPVVAGKVLQGLVDVRLIPVCLDHGGFEVVRDQDLGNTFQKLQTAGQCVQKIPLGLGRYGHGKGVVREGQAGHKQLALDQFACFTVDIGNGFSRKINVEFLGSGMFQD